MDNRIESTEEFDFIKRFVASYESSLPSSTEETLGYVSYGPGLIQGIIANNFIRDIRRSITSEFKDRATIYQLSAEKYSDRDSESKRICNLYQNFNIDVAEVYTEKNEDKTNLIVLPKNKLSAEDIEKIVSKSEKWSDFLFRVKREFGETIGRGWNLEYPLVVEGLALKVKPDLERDYKDTGMGLDLWYDDGDFIGLRVDGFKRAEQIGCEIPELTLNNIDEKLAKELIGKKVDYHLDYLIRSDYGMIPFGDLIRIL
jgi:hypothetical protein